MSPHLPNWKNESIETILSVASLYGGFLFQFHQTIDDAKKNVENLDFSKAIHQINLFELKDSPLLQSSLKSTQEKEKTGMTQKVIELTFGAQKDQPISDFKN